MKCIRFLLFAAILPLAAQNPAEVFLRSLVESIDSVSGTVEFELLPGKTSTHIDGWPDVQWEVLPSDGGGPAKATVEFDYGNGSLRKARIVYTPWINISNSLAASMEYDPKGRLTALRDNQGNDLLAGMVPTDQATLQRHLEFSSAPAGVFLGRPVAGLPPLHAATGPRGFLSRIKVSNLRVTFKDQGVLRWPAGASGTPDTTITLASPSSVLFRQIVYDFVGQTLDGSLESLDVVVHEGRVYTGPVDLRLKRQSRVQFASILFRWPEQNGISVESANGFIKGEAGVGTTLSVGTDNPISQFSSDYGSELDLQGVRFLSGSGGAELDLGAGSEVQLRLSDFAMPLGKNSFARGRNGVLVSTLQGAWKPGAKPAVQGTITMLQADLYAGTFGVEGGDAAALRGGAIRSSGLTFDTSQSPWLVGKLDYVSMEFENGAVFSIPNQYKVTCSLGARLASDATAPVQISADGRMTGTLGIFLPFNLMETADGKAAMRDGVTRATITLRSDGKVEARNMLAHGTINAPFQIGNENKTLEAKVYFEDGSWTYAPDGKIQFAAFIEAEIKPFGAFDMMFPDTLTDDFIHWRAFRARITFHYILLSMSFDHTLHLARQHIKRSGDDWSGDDVENRTPVGITVKPRDEKAGQDGDGKRQEAVRLGCLTGIGEHTDITLYPETYTPDLIVKLVYPNHVPKLSLKPDMHEVDHDLNKCSGDSVIGSVLAGGLLGLILSPVLGPGAFVLGVELGAVTMDMLPNILLNNKISDLLETKLERCIEFQAHPKFGGC